MLNMMRYCRDGILRLMSSVGFPPRVALYAKYKCSMQVSSDQRAIFHMSCLQHALNGILNNVWLQPVAPELI